MPSDLMTIPEAAEALRVHHTTLRGWIRKGRFPASRIGDKHYRIRPADLEDYIARTQVAPSPIDDGRDLPDELRKYL